jgi:hypothetical protein
MNDKRLHIQIPADEKMAGCEKSRESLSLRKCSGPSLGAGSSTEISEDERLTVCRAMSQELEEALFQGTRWMFTISGEPAIQGNQHTNLGHANLKGSVASLCGRI